MPFSPPQMDPDGDLLPFAHQDEATLALWRTWRHARTFGAGFALVSLLGHEPGSTHSAPVVAIWPGRGLAALATPEGRSAFALSFERAFPGWLLSCHEAPKDGALALVAALGIRPASNFTSGGKQVSAATQGGAATRCLAWTMFEHIDGLVGAPSARFVAKNHDLDQGAGAETRLLAKALSAKTFDPERWAALDPAPERHICGPGVGFAGLAGAFEALALAAACPPPEARSSAPSMRL